VLTISQNLKLGDPPALAARLDLAEALRNGWIEFWYQPKIDLRKKQLVGIEAFTRARHPQNGVLMPSAFMPGAKESDLIALSEQALAHSKPTSTSPSSASICDSRSIFRSTRWSRSP
jgi:predicted signal transduction protein with EAL and GGDEF domain